MKIEEFEAGKWESGYDYKYFVPTLINQSFSWNDEKINQLLERASLKLGELNSFSRLVPDIDIFIIMHVLKEAVVSSRIEGTQTNIEEALESEENIEPEKRDDWLEVNNYVKALKQALNELNTLPISCRLIRNAHKMLLASGRGKHKTPGEFRRSQNWIGGSSIKNAVFGPPAVEKLDELLTDFEKFLNNKDLLIPELIRIAIAHYQFETIHPFLDGNGRIGRLLIPLYLVSVGVMEKPLLYMSDFFEKDRTLYYDNLSMTREKNNLSRWIQYFLLGVAETAEQEICTLQKIMQLKTRLEEKIMTMGKRSANAHKLLIELFRTPIVTVKDVCSITGLTPKSAGELVNHFIDKNILKEITDRQRNRTFSFWEYLILFD